MGTRSRLAVAATLSFTPAVFLAARLIQLQVVRGERLEQRASGAFERRSQEIQARADILDREGRILAHSVPTWSCFIDERMVDKPGEAARAAQAVGLSVEALKSKMRGPGKFAWLRTGLSFEEMSKIAAAKVDCLGLTASQERIYPNDGLARATLGSVNAEGRGAAGLELAFESQLAGGTRRFETIRDGSGHYIYRASEEPEPPPPLRLTLDRRVQFFCEDALRESAEKFKIRSGMIAVQDPQNGEILALATYPSDPLKNPAAQDPFEPGSTFKIITAAAAIAGQTLPEGETVFCENGAYEIAPGVRISDHEPEGALTLSQVIERSSNIGVAKLVQKIGASKFFSLTRSFGFASKTGLPLPGEAAGSLRPIADLTPVTLAASSYGYGVSVTALQLLGAYSAVANGGTLLEPVIEAGRPPAKVRRVADPKVVAKLSEILEGVVERGTGVAAQIPGYRVAGKTGTARKLDPNGRYSQQRYTASFVGYAPASRPAFTVLIVIDEPRGQYYGSSVAAPVFAKVGRSILALRGIAPDKALTAALK